MKTITIKKIPFPTWEEFENEKFFEIKIRGIEVCLKLAMNDLNLLSYIYANDDDFVYQFLSITKQGYTEACEFLQAEWEKLIESMASLCEGE